VVLDAAQGAWHVIPTILSTAVAEELVYRGVVLSWCERRMSLRSAILCSSVLYALPLAASGSWLLFVLGLCLGTLWSVARVATHGLLVPFLAHGLWSLTTFVVMPLVL
jgi:membrane protease YdiL (CAAX protease family)